ncbi:MAG: hypothetical protein RL685_120 [Pseudomonadota bacterium]
MDEGWSIISAHGQWPPDNPLSGMTAYSGPFPRWLLAALGDQAGIGALRGISVLCNALALLLAGRLLQRLLPAEALRGWALPLLATTPVWLVCTRHALEVLAFMPLLCVLGLYLLMLRKPWAAFAAGVSWGLLIYNHLIGICFPAAVFVAWFTVYWRRPPIAWLPLLGGFLLGLGPRLISVALYHDHALEGSAANYGFARALLDLPWLPGIFWDTFTGRNVFLRYVGQVTVQVWPYWLLALLLLIPWLRQPLKIPRHVWMSLGCSVCFTLFAALVAPYFAVRFLLVPIVTLVAAVVQLAAATIVQHPRWRWLARGTVAALIAAQLCYVFVNFYRPWQKSDLQFAFFHLGDRSPRTTSEGFLPKHELARYLRQLDPPPQQIIAPSTLERPLHALLIDLPIHFADPVEVTDATLRSVHVDYLRRELPWQDCIHTAAGKMCFDTVEQTAEFFFVGH